MTEIRALRPEDDRTHFRSGNPDIDRFFQRFAGQNQFRHHLGVTYVAVDGESVIGFITVSAAQLETATLADELKRTLPRYPLPALRVSRLGVAETAKGRGIGSGLVRFGFNLAHEMADKIGCIGVVVDAKDDAVVFYERLGFVKLTVAIGELGDRPKPTTMFVPLGRIPRLSA